jgi:hypothetical protein
MTAPRDLHSYKHFYLVNLHLQPGQVLPTFTPVMRDSVTRKYPRVSGGAVQGMALYYTDEPVNEDSPGDLMKHTTLVTRGGPNVVRPDKDDAELLRQLQHSGTFSTEALRDAEDNATVMSATLAADGHFRFGLL